MCNNFDMDKRLISVRLDAVALAALEKLTRSGVSRSRAIGDALIEKAVRAEAATLAADEADRREADDVLGVMAARRLMPVERRRGLVGSAEFLVSDDELIEPLYEDRAPDSPTR
jgi:hypothetical protein